MHPTESIPRTSGSAVLQASYTQCDFIDPRIDVDAQYALFGMLRSDSASRRTALDILAAVKAGILSGVYKQDQRAPALRAQKLGRGWWQLVPRGADAVCLTEPPFEAPMIVLARSLGSDQSRIARALRIAWPACGLGSLPPPPPRGGPCSRPPRRREPIPDDRPPDDRPPDDRPPTPREAVCSIAGRGNSVSSRHVRFVLAQGIGINGTFTTEASASVPIGSKEPCVLLVDAQITTAIANRVRPFGSFVAVVNGVRQASVPLVPRRPAISGPNTRVVGEGSITLPSGPFDGLLTEVTTGYVLPQSGGNIIQSATDIIVLV